MDFIIAISLLICSTIVDLIHLYILRMYFMTVDEIKSHFNFRFDKELMPIFKVSSSTVSNWRNKGIPLLWQQAIQLKSNNELITRIEDIDLSEKDADGNES